MEFPHKFFEDEVREGFYISGLIKRSWASQLEVLFEVDKVCRKHNIKWFADCGTLLGTIRHGGYIPWDDDLDICMLRPDYEKFLRYAPKELPEGYVVLNCFKEDEDYFEHLTRVANGHRLNFDKDFLEKYHDSPYATGIDVFPLDYIAEDPVEEKERKELLDLLMPLGDEIKEDGSNVMDYIDVIHQVEEICQMKVDFNRSVKHQIYWMTEKVFSLYSHVGGKYVALMPYWVYFDNHKYPARYFDRTVMMPFEFTEMPVPAAYDGVLNIEYGDYMRIVKGGGVHEYPCYEKQEEHLIGLMENYPFRYKYKPEDLENPNRVKKDKPRKQANDFLDLISQAHEAIIASIYAGKLNDAMQLLTACQESAINIGNLLEDRFGEGFVTVKTLEEYCEIIYQVSELVNSANETGEFGLPEQDLRGFLNEIYNAISASVEANIPDKKEILFIVQNASKWKALESVWRKYKEDENNTVYVMPVPYCERTATGAMGEVYYEGTEFPDYLPVINYTKYNIVKRHPDKIIIQEPYDNCNYTTSVMPEYYSGNIKAYTDELIYIPWFKVDEIGADSDKAKKVMQYYVKMPALFHADKVIVQSEPTRHEYIEYLTGITGEEKRSTWEKKIIAGGSPLDDYSIRPLSLTTKLKALEHLPEDWKSYIVDENGNMKKVILYNTTVASYARCGVDLLDKISRSFDIFEQNKDKISVLWRPHRELRALIASKNPKHVKRYDALVSFFQEHGLGIKDENERLEDVLNICDAYYGDADGVAHRCELEKMPAMIQNVDI